MIATIRLQNFRSYADTAFVFSSGVNIIVGPNASGKTNLLEAILVVARGSSYRVRDADMVAFGAPWARLDVQADNEERVVKLVCGPALEKTYDIAGRVFHRLTLAHSLPVVLFEPNHLALLGGSPERRRDYLDDLLTQTEPGYAATVRSYRRALAQRNRLLKTPQATADQFFPWNVRLSELAARIVRSRVGLTAALNGAIGPLYGELSRTATSVAIEYAGRADAAHYESHMVRRLELCLNDDRLRGFTSFGPHREDFVVLFDGRPAAEVASRGEVRTVVLGLKIIELRMLESLRDIRPILLLDDVFSELDAARRRALTTHLQPYQTFITTTDADVVSRHFADQSTIIRLEGGLAGGAA